MKIAFKRKRKKTTTASEEGANLLHFSVLWGRGCDRLKGGKNRKERAALGKPG